MKILKVENLSKIYGKGNTEVKALDNISFDVEEGEFIAIIGPSGSGKSTLLHSIAGLERATNGNVYFYDKELISNEKKLNNVVRAVVTSLEKKGFVVSENDVKNIIAGIEKIVTDLRFKQINS